MLIADDPEVLAELRKRWEAGVLADRAAGMGWGALAKKYHWNKSTGRRIVLKLQSAVAIKSEEGR